MQTSDWLQLARFVGVLALFTKPLGLYLVQVLSLLVLCLSILGFTACASVSEWGSAGLNNQGPHGLSEMLYACSSATGNNGSAFAGLTANTPCYNTTLGLAMLIGRFLPTSPHLPSARPCPCRPRPRFPRVESSSGAIDALSTAVNR